MQWGVGVPCVGKAPPVGMDEGEDGREGSVVVGYIGEVGHRFVAFVLRGRERCVGGGGGGVDGVDCMLPAVVG